LSIDASNGRRQGRSFKQRLAVALRWSHLYLSMLSFLVVLFFSATGITLNHPEALAARVQQRERSGQVSPTWLEDPQRQKLEIVEYLRSKHGVRGLVDSFEITRSECTVSFKGPGYAADALIERPGGALTLTTSAEGAVAILNDLHKGRHSGAVWSLAIDLSAGFLVVVSLTGIGLLLFMKKVRMVALATLVVGGLIAVGTAWFALK
jgi:hypothetical protein